MCVCQNCLRHCPSAKRRRNHTLPPHFCLSLSSWKYACFFMFQQYSFYSTVTLRTPEFSKARKAPLFRGFSRAYFFPREEGKKVFCRSNFHTCASSLSLSLSPFSDVVLGLRRKLGRLDLRKREREKERGEGISVCARSAGLKGKRNREGNREAWEGANWK